VIGAIVYAYAYVYFTYTVVFALVEDVADYDELSDRLGAWMVAHGALMLIGALALGGAILWHAAYPRWTGAVLILGVVLVTLGLPGVLGFLAAAVRAVAWLGMGLALLTERGPLSRPAAPAAARAAGPGPR
jgi:hypothetical protein